MTGALVALLVVGVMSATVLDFEPGAYAAGVALLALVAGRLLGILPGTDGEGD